MKDAEKELLKIVNDIIYFRRRIRVPSELSKMLYVKQILQVFEAIKELEGEDDATTDTD